MNNQLYAVVLAGGSGTRLWPLSRKYSPKQLLKLIKGKSLLEMTLKRCSRFILPQNIVVVSSADMSSEVKTSIQSTLLKKINFIDEPASKNTATAIGVAAAYVANRDPDGMLIVMPSDHLIENDGKLQEAINFAVDPASQQSLVTFGIKPHSPDTGFGYIKPGNPVLSKNSLHAYRVDSFYEKPNADKAKELIDMGCLWNSGIFVFNAKTLLNEIQKHLPQLGNALGKLAADYSQKNFLKIYGLQDSVSIDHGVFEKAQNVVVIPLDIQWKDLGNVLAIEQIHKKDKQGNVIVGNSIDIDSKNSLIYANDHLIATIGLDNIAVIDTADATLICDKKRVQDVRKIVELIKKHGGEEHLIHTTVERPWGNYTVLNKGDGFKVKRVIVKPEQALSVQFHRKRSEHWVIVSGKAKIQKENEVIHLYPGESTFIPLNMNHRLENPGPDMLILIEVQIGSYLEEDDIERISDNYDRH